MSLPRSTGALAALLATTGVGHFVIPGPLDAIVPEHLPGSPRSWTYLSGAAELACAAALAHPRTRSVGAGAAAALFVAVLPANVSMALRWHDRPAMMRAAAWARVPLQIPLVLWALRSR